METKKYTFQPEKKFVKQGFFMTDENNEKVYEAKVLKQGIITASKFEFINYITNKKEEHKIGHTITLEQEGAFELIATKSYFKYDGKKIWDYLHDEGIRIDSSISKGKIGMTYSISLKGQDIATIAMTSPTGEDSIINSRNWLSIKTSEEYLDIIFLVAFSLSRTEQIFYD